MKFLLFFRMFRNQYDSSASTWSPQGRIHQIEYAMEAVKQGSATVGVKSKTHAVIVALKVLFSQPRYDFKTDSSALKTIYLLIKRSVSELHPIVE